MPERYVWITWSCIFLMGWCVVYFAAPGLRTALWRVGLGTVPLGFTEPLFVPHYWNPPGIVGVHTVHLDIESFIFCFDIGGLAAVVYNFATVTDSYSEENRGRLSQRAVAHVCRALPVRVLRADLPDTNRPLWSGSPVLLAGAVVRMVRFPELRRKILVGGAMYCCYYVGALELLRVISP